MVKKLDEITGHIMQHNIILDRCMFFIVLFFIGTIVPLSILPI